MRTKLSNLVKESCMCITQELVLGGWCFDCIESVVVLDVSPPATVT